MRIPAAGRHRAQRIGAAARIVARRTPETLTVVRYRAQPNAVTIVRLATTAVFAYLLALLLPGPTAQPVLAPLTALLVERVTLYQTVRSAVSRVAAVVTGVLVAVALSPLVGFTWWSLGITVAAGLALGYLLHLGETVLEVPFSAMLILSVGTRSEAATGRIVETLIGAGAGLIAGGVMASRSVESARDAIEDLCGKMADLLDQIAAGLRQGATADSADGWLAQSRALAGEIRRVGDAVREAEESARLSPRNLRRPTEAVRLRNVLETLEHAAITIRTLTRSIADLTRLGEDYAFMHDPDQQSRLADALAELSAAVRDYGRFATEHAAAARQRAEMELRRHLDAARDLQDRLSLALAADPAERPVGWPLRGELVSHINRLRGELEPGEAGLASPHRIRSWRLPLQVARLRRRQQPLRDDR